MAGKTSQSIPTRPRIGFNSSHRFTQTKEYHNRPSSQSSRWKLVNGSWKDLNMEVMTPRTTNIAAPSNGSTPVPTVVDSRRASNTLDPTATMYTPPQSTMSERILLKSLAFAPVNPPLESPDEKLSIVKHLRQKGLGEHAYHEAKEAHAQDMLNLLKLTETVEKNDTVDTNSNTFQILRYITIELGELELLTDDCILGNLALQLFTRHLYGNNCCGLQTLQDEYETLTNLDQNLLDKIDHWWERWLGILEPVPEGFHWYGTDTVPVLPTDSPRDFNVVVGSTPSHRSTASRQLTAKYS